jgi:hypothetical protein
VNVLSDSKDSRLDPDLEPKNLISFPDEDASGAHVLQSIQDMWGPTPFDEEEIRRKEKRMKRR